ncbi:MAG: CvpA family protein [Candidatus Fibromonas sp.]|nr:CvpA family protein [Candidatus Fibromonas sp.]
MPPLLFSTFYLNVNRCNCFYAYSHFLIFGIRDGFVVSVLYLAAWVIGILCAWLFGGAFGSMLSANIEGLAPLLALCLGTFLAFLLPFLLLRVAARIAKFFIKKSTALTTANRVLGGVFGALKGVAASAIILTVIHFLPAQGSLKQAKKDSVSYSVYKQVPFANMWKDFKAEAKELIVEI